ncbi:MAG: TatD family hydrolase [Candidatus Nanopelagicales bacterium]
MSAAEALPEPPEGLPAPVIDSHCHLDITAEFSGLAPAEAVAAAAAVGVDGIVQVGVDLDSSRRSIALAQEFPHVVAAVALHPNEAPTADLDRDLAVLAELARSPEVVAIGETGLDHYRTDDSGRAAQEESFRQHIRLAADRDLTLVIHDREAHADVLRVLESEDPPQRVVFHCFSGDAAMAAECAGNGWFLSFPGVVTFKNAQGLRDAVAVTPPEQMLVETDAPFLTPAPNRGRPNASYLMPWTVRELAATSGLDLADLCRQLRANTVRAFASGFGW